VILAAKAVKQPQRSKLANNSGMVGQHEYALFGVLPQVTVLAVKADLPFMFECLEWGATV
jgi:hypothetical protein